MARPLVLDSTTTTLVNKTLMRGVQFGLLHPLSIQAAIPAIC